MKSRLPPFAHHCANKPGVICHGRLFVRGRNIVHSIGRQKCGVKLSERNPRISPTPFLPSLPWRRERNAIYKAKPKESPCPTSNPPINSSPFPIFMSRRDKLLNHTIILLGTFELERMSRALENPLHNPAPGANAPDEHVGMLAPDHGVHVAGADKDVPDLLAEHL